MFSDLVLESLQQMMSAGNMLHCRRLLSDSLNLGCSPWFHWGFLILKYWQEIIAGYGTKTALNR